MSKVLETVKKHAISPYEACRLVGEITSEQIISRRFQKLSAQASDF